MSGTRSLSSTGMDYPDNPHTDMGRISLLPPGISTTIELHTTLPITGPARVRSASEHRHEDTGQDGRDYL